MGCQRTHDVLTEILEHASFAEGMATMLENEGAGFDDLERIFQANELLNRAGIDSISAGTTIAWAFECFERGLLTEADTGGLALRWGDAALVLRGLLLAVG